MTFSSVRRWHLTNDKRLTVSLYEMYEIHTTQQGTGTRPGDTFNLDYSVMVALPFAGDWRLQVGVAGYDQRQTTAKTGPSITEAQTLERYAVNAIGLATSATFPEQKFSAGIRFFEEFANRATYQGYSLQFSVAFHF